MRDHRAVPTLLRPIVAVVIIITVTDEALEHCEANPSLYVRVSGGYARREALLSIYGQGGGGFGNDRRFSW
jgi:hypothetical protein